MDDDDLYRDNLLAHYRRPHNWAPTSPEMVRVDREHRELNPLCGDELTVQIAVSDSGTVEDVRIHGQGCAVVIAGASMASDEIRGCRVSELETLRPDFMLDLLGIQISPTRMKCALLPFKVIKSVALGHSAPWDVPGG